MSLDFSGLGDIAKAPKTKKGWTPLAIDDLADGAVVGLDQSLTASGWVLLAKFGPMAEVITAGQLKGGYDGPDDKAGLLTDLRRGVALKRHYQISVVDTAVRANADLVHESPPSPGRVKGSGISSLLAALSFRIACNEVGIEPLMYGSQPAKALVCGNANAEKKVAHAALVENVLPWLEGGHLITNEAKRDALLIALLHLKRKKS